jgi:uncharacterized protein YbjT (DUF2867 family)
MVTLAPTPQKILVSGASGYVGRRLVRRLSEAGYHVRCLARRPEFLRGRFSESVEIVQGDVLDPASLARAMAGMDAAYYLVHSMAAGAEFEELDRRGAKNFGYAAKAAGLERIIYLGGLGDTWGELSAHLRSRQEVGRMLVADGVITLELRASIVIGSGSLSFELIRALVERLPVMITPRWVSVAAQPIAIADLLEYLVQALRLPASGHQILEIGGRQQVSYGDLMREYARQRKLRRLMITVPVLTPRLSSLWLALVTPIYARIGRTLVDSLRHPTVVHDPTGMSCFTIQPRGVREAVAEALRNEDCEFAETLWSDAVSSSSVGRTWGGVRFGNRLVDQRLVRIAATPAEVFRVIKRIGGRTGWYYGTWLWHLRGFLDLLVGGVGVRRGRRNPEDLRIGDTVDWWRVEEAVPDRRVRFIAEMKLPGRAWLEFDIGPDDAGSVLRQTAIFDPVGLTGLAYWYGIYPLHALVFGGMLRGIASVAGTRDALQVPAQRRPPDSPEATP